MLVALLLHVVSAAATPTPTPTAPQVPLPLPPATGGGPGRAFVEVVIIVAMIGIVTVGLLVARGYSETRRRDRMRREGPPDSPSQERL